MEHAQFFALKEISHHKDFAMKLNIKECCLHIFKSENIQSSWKYPSRCFILNLTMASKVFYWIKFSAIRTREK